MSKSSLNIKSILVVDDDKESLDFYSELLRKSTRANVMSTTHPSVALKWANKYFFDIILIDVTINYHDTPYGGLEIYNGLRSRYGDSSLIIYSKVINDNLLRRYDEEYNFIEIDIDPDRFINNVTKLMATLRKRQSCFVAMPFNVKYDEVYNVIKKSVTESFYRCVRVDGEQFNKSIIDTIFSEIANAKLIVFLATDKNPNAYYECGYAVALGKEVITLTDIHENLPFDIRDRNSLAYGNNQRKLRTILNGKLKKLTHLPI